jgi:hypothetical protein
LIAAERGFCKCGAAEESLRGSVKAYAPAGNRDRVGEASQAPPLRFTNSSPKVIRLMVLLYVCFSLRLRNVEDLLFERRIDTCHETVRL